MRLSKHVHYLYVIVMLMLLVSCNRPKRIYLANKTDKAITLYIDTTFDMGKNNILSEFKKSLDGKRIEPGSSTINFGSGKWDVVEEEMLKLLLQNTTVTKDGSNKKFRLPEDLKIGHGILIPELIIKIEELK